MNEHGRLGKLLKSQKAVRVNGEREREKEGEKN